MTVSPSYPNAPGVEESGYQIRILMCQTTHEGHTGWRWEERKRWDEVEKGERGRKIRRVGKLLLPKGRTCKARGESAPCLNAFVSLLWGTGSHRLLKSNFLLQLTSVISSIFCNSCFINVHIDCLPGKLAYKRYRTHNFPDVWIQLGGTNVLSTCS